MKVVLLSEFMDTIGSSLCTIEQLIQKISQQKMEEELEKLKKEKEKENENQGILRI